MDALPNLQLVLGKVGATGLFILLQKDEIRCFPGLMALLKNNG